MRPIIKWPGGKSGEIAEIEPLIPSYNRYIEPFSVAEPCFSSRA